MMHIQSKYIVLTSSSVFVGAQYCIWVSLLSEPILVSPSLVRPCMEYCNIWIYAVYFSCNKTVMVFLLFCSHFCKFLHIQYWNKADWFHIHMYQDNKFVYFSKIFFYIHVYFSMLLCSSFTINFYTDSVYIVNQISSC